MVLWINHVPYADSEGKLRALYDRVKGPADNIDNIMLAHSLRPHTMEGHMALYKATLHHSRNTIARWFLEALGVYTSLLNGCGYCVAHHFIGMKRQLKDDSRTATIRAAFESEDLSSAFSAQEVAAIEYTRMLTKLPYSLTQDDIESMRIAGWPDDQILEINQVVAYFNYANRTVLGLGVSTDGDVLGLSPNEANDPEDWSHRPVQD
ncbi:peroxidase-related enzyme [Candidatus Bipolaricaulota bacterium]|nr:peroxidase-related enzyme [Candidatus Bipolaricaulota bacterium]